jgi:hypothetical protein
VLLRDGHAWGRKQVVIPFGAVTGLDDGSRRSLSKEQVRDLPSADA